MIYELQHMPPAIDFGFGITSISIKAGETVTVWQNTLRPPGYKYKFTAVGARITTVSNFEYKLTYTTPGRYQASIETIINVFGEDPNRGSLSNILKITVV